MISNPISTAMKPKYLGNPDRTANLRGLVLVGGLTLGLLASARADSLVLSSSPSIAIPDGNASGTFSLLDVPAGTGFVTDVNLSLTLEGTGGGGWNGDLLILLTHGGTASYLVNRPGRTAVNSFGYGDNGFAGLVFDDEAAGDAHLYQPALGLVGDSLLPITGSLQPDGRGADPDLVLDTDSRSFALDVFDGSLADGSWGLLLFDLAPGGTFNLVHWELEVSYGPTGMIPETGRGVVLAGATVVGLGAWRWRSRRREALQLGMVSAPRR